MRVKLIKPVAGYKAPPIIISVSVMRGQAMIRMGVAERIDEDTAVRPKAKRKKATNRKAESREKRG